MHFAKYWKEVKLLFQVKISLHAASKNGVGLVEAAHRLVTMNRLPVFILDIK